MISKESRLKEFKDKWSELRIKALTIDEYAGNGKDNNNFCYDLERGFADLGGIKGGSSFKFGIYKRKSEAKDNQDRYKHDKEYSWLAYLSKGNSAKEAFSTVKNLIMEVIELAKNNRLEDIDRIRLHQFVRWKIAFIYAPENVISIYSKKALVYLCSVRGVNFDHKTPVSAMNRFLIERIPDELSVVQFGSVLWNEYANSDDYEGSQKRGVSNKTATISIDPREDADKPSVEDNIEAEEAEKELTIAHLFDGFEIIRSDSIDPVFKVKLIAEQFVKLLRNLDQEEGQMVGIFGQWGRGKTFFVKQLCNILSIDYHTSQSVNDGRTKSFNFVKFHAWKYQDTEAVWAYLYECLSEKYLGSNPFFRFVNRVWLNSRRLLINGLSAFLITTVVLLPIVLFLFYNEYLPEDLELSSIPFSPTIWGSLFGSVSLTFIYYYRKYGQKARSVIKRYTEKVSFKETLGLQAEIQNEIVCLLKAWYWKYEKWPLRLFYKEPPRVLLFIDDLDRCGVKKMVHVIDALRVMLEDPMIIKRLLILVAVDQEKLKIAIKNKYFDSLDKLVDEDALMVQLTNLEKEYMDKLFISGIHLSKLNENERLEFFTALTQDHVERKSTTNKDKGSAATVEKSTQKGEGQGKADNSTSLKRNSIPGIQEEEIRSFEISLDEKDVLDEVIRNMDDATPRQIRIYYYRYLLAKNILSQIETERLTRDEIQYLSKAIDVKRQTNQSNGNSRVDYVVDMVVAY